MSLKVCSPNCRGSCGDTACRAGASACPLLPHREQGLPNHHWWGCNSHGTAQCVQEPQASPGWEGAGCSHGLAAVLGCSSEPRPHPLTAPSLAVVGRQGLAEEVKDSKGQQFNILFFT